MTFNRVRSRSAAFNRVCAGMCSALSPKYAHTANISKA